MKKILFICYGNVGRSQMAEAFANKLTGINIAVSAGIIDARNIIGDHPLENVTEVMQEVGIDISGHSPRKLTENMLNNVTTVAVLCKKSDCPPYILNRPNVLYHEFLDPYRKDLTATRLIRDNISKFTADLVNQILTNNNSKTA